MATPKITLYTAGSPNGQKVSILLEELGVPYNAREMVLANAEHKQPWYLKINPVGHIPAITDHTRGDFNVFESGAIIIYICEHYDPEGKFLPKDANLKSQVMQWVMFGMSDLGPMQQQANFYLRFSNINVPFGKKRYPELLKNFYGVLNNALEGKEYLVGNKYTLADIMNYPLVRTHFFSGVQSIDEFPNLKAWVARIDARPATQKGLGVPVPDRLKDFTEHPEKLEEFCNVVREANAKYTNLGKEEYTSLGQ